MRLWFPLCFSLGLKFIFPQPEKSAGNPRPFGVASYSQGVLQLLLAVWGSKLEECDFHWHLDHFFMGSWGTVGCLLFFFSWRSLRQKWKKNKGKMVFSRQKGIRFQRSQVWVFKWKMNLPRYQGDSDFERIGTMLATKVTLSCWWDVMGKWKKKRGQRCGWHDWDLQGTLSSQIHCIQIHMYLKIH